MQADLEEIIPKMFIIDENKIDIKKFKIEYNDKTWRKLYDNYIGYQELDLIGKFDYKNQLLKSYTKKRIWFRNVFLENKVNGSQIIACKDGINVVIEKGAFIDAGQIQEDDYYNQKEKDKLKDLVYLVNPKYYHSADVNKFVFYNGNSILNILERQVVRFYFNLKIEKKDVLEAFIFELGKQLNNRFLPYTCKVPLELKNFGRRDTLVLYIYQSHFSLVYEIVSKLYSFFREKDNIFHCTSPLFTKILHPGVSIAEDPMTVESFGENRCKEICEILNSQNDNILSLEKLNDILKNKGFNKGYFRNPNTHFDYDSIIRRQYAVVKGRFHFGNKIYYKYNNLALQYGLDLIQNAIWKSNTDFYWGSYNEDGQIPCYKILTFDNEGKEIYWFLYKLIKIKSNRSLFTNNVIEIIENKFNNLNDRSLFSYYSKKYEDFFKELNKEKLNSYKDLIFKAKSFAFISFEEFSELYKEKKYNFLDKLLGQRLPRIDFQSFYRNKLIYESKEAKKLAEDFFLLIEKNQYPIPNEFGNFEYCPSLQGKLKIALLMLFVFCPSLADD